MNRTPAAALIALVLLALVFLPGTPASAKPIKGGYRAQGGRIVPRSFEFGSLLRREPSEGLIVEVPRPRAMDEAEFEREMEQLKRHPHARTPEEMGNVTIDRNTSPFGIAARPELIPFAPIANNGFEGITQSGYIPGEPTVAAGPLNVFTAGNSTITVTNKDGTSRVETNGATFFGVTPGEGGISDAQCYYDALRARFVALCFTSGTTYSNFYLAISKTNDARGAWWLYKFDMTVNGAVPSGNWADYQSLGISEDKIAMTAQMFSLSGGNFRYQKVRVLDRVAAYSGQPLSYVDFYDWAPPTGGDYHDLFVTKAARNLTAGDNDIHMLCVPVIGGVTVTSTTIFGPPSSPTMSPGVRVPVRAYGMSPSAAQKGSGVLVPTNDSRPTDFYVRNGVLTLAWHESVSLGGIVSAIRLLQLRLSDLTVVTDETFAASGMFLYYPAVTVDSVGTIFLGFDRSSATEYPSMYITGKRRGDATLQPSTLLRSGVSASAASRWGDYTGIDNDAALSGPGGAVAWYAGQYTKGTNTFGTWINRVTFTYGQIGGTVSDDCDGLTATAGDRTPRSGVTLTLKQGATVVATTTTNASGAFNFGYLETGTYDVVVTPPSGGSAVDAIAGSGGTSQVRIAADDVQASITNAQNSTGNTFLVTGTHASPVTTGLSPFGRVAGSGAFTLTVNGSGFEKCSVVRWDGADRVTTWVSASQLTAAIPAGDITAAGTHSVTVFSPAPSGGTSNAQTFTTTSGPDTQAPVVTITSPTGGESWAIGSTHAVTWNATDNTGVSAVNLAWSGDGGVTFPNVIASGIPNTGSYNWTLSGLPSATARVRARGYDGGGNVGSDSSHTNFTVAGWTITASAGANGSISPVGTTGVGDGATPLYTFTPASGYQVANVLVNGVSVGTPANYTFAAVHANQTISVTFAAMFYPINVSVVGTGTVTRNPDLANYPSGTSVTLTATAPPGWAFNTWSGDLNSTANPVGLTVTSARNITATFSQHVYTFNQTGTAAWDTPTNWTPTRTAPASDDMLIFNGGGTVTVMNIPTQTIGRLSLGNNTTVVLDAPLDAMITIAGRAGTDFEVPAGCALNFTNSSAITVAIATGATGLVGGTINVSSSAHRLAAKDGGSLVFVGGSQVLIGTGFTGSFFSAGPILSGSNSVVMQLGSLLAQATGSNPFGLAVPSSNLIFQAGSRYRVDGNLVFAAAGRTYADVEMNYTGALTVTGTTAFSLDSLIVSKGTLNWNTTGGGTIRGNILVKSGATLAFNPASGTPVATLAGAVPQYVQVLGTFTNLANAGFAVNNASGVLLRSNLNLAGPLTFTAGRIVTGATSTLGVTGTGSVSGASGATGWVVGNLRRNFASGASTRTFDVGDFTVYSPLTLSLSGAAAAFDITASATSGDHPEIATSDLDANQSVNRYWTLSRTAATAFGSYDATFTYAPADLDAGVNTDSLVGRRYSGGWTLPVTGAHTTTSTQLTGLTAFGDFALGEISAIDTTLPTVAVTSPNGGEVLLAGNNASLTWNASDNFGVTGVDLYLSRNGAAGPFDALATGLANSGTYSWAVTAPYTSTALLRAVAHDAAGNTRADTSNALFAILAATGVDGGPVTEFALSPAFPNPMRAGGTFAFALPRASRARLSLLDVQGRQVMLLADGEYPAGRHAVEWSGRDGRALGAGLYFVRLQVDGRTFTRRFVLAK